MAEERPANATKRVRRQIYEWQMGRGIESKWEDWYV